MSNVLEVSKAVVDDAPEPKAQVGEPQPWAHFFANFSTSEKRKGEGIPSYPDIS